ncbi:HvfC/BufC N-terminal domain-containing protein [Pontibaca salina]|uniref:DNA-binding domain-containing protein n=1 Tax=Pontibaca salina TaxID=2795731 RepID=A0A934HS38_9RHOB|nr:DNA-binding domain-containing protein [Pontibaca salina]MBI6630752.1 putative DNA-binding domain-containing protein [Pontibaca salina]
MSGFPDLVSDFATGLIDGDVPQGVTAREPDETAQRFAVYRNNVATSLTNALAKRFPVIKRLVGDDFFGAMGRVYLDAHRPRSPVLLDWGATFPDFLVGFPPLAQYPYMADVARIELARGRAYHAADTDPVAVEALTKTASDPEHARFALHPSVQILRLAHPAVTIWRANQPGATGKIPTLAGAEIALILRDSRYQVPVTAVGAGDAALIEALQERQTLLIAAELAAFAEAGHDPQPILLYLIQADALTLPKETP